MYVGGGGGVVVLLLRARMQRLGAAWGKQKKRSSASISTKMLISRAMPKV